MDNLRQRVQDVSNVSLQLNYTGALGTSMPNQVWKDIVNIKTATSKDVENGLKNMSGTLWQCPMKIDGFQLPIDPMIYKFVIISSYQQTFYRYAPVILRPALLDGASH